MWIAQSVYHSLLLFYLPCFMFRHGECSAPHWKPNFAFVIYNGDRTECSPIRSVVIRIVQPRNGSLCCLITSMITDRIGRHKVLLPINHNYNKGCYVLSYFKIKHKIFRECLPAVKNTTIIKKTFKCARGGACCPITKA